ncbi:hypothetical protein OO010_05010 [Flavobacteriaceae bacterium KMM 6898]|nr:hypothetical protein [Flavobacteriaceae bacterium KMM 6898]
MKFTLPRFLVMAAASMLFYTTSHAQVTHTIFLNINTTLLNDGDTDGAFSFSVSAGTVSENINDKKNFTIFVNEGDTIEWEGNSSSGAEVQIDEISYVNEENSSNIFRKPKISGRRSNGKTKVKVKVEKEKKGKSYTYNIAFSIGTSSFSIDPKIRVE